MASLYNVNCASPESFQFKLGASKFISQFDYDPDYDVTSIINRVNDPSRKYDPETLVDAMNLVLNDFRNELTDQEREQYPTLNDRLNQGDMTYQEFAGFLEWSGLPITKIESSMNNVTDRNGIVYKQIDYYLDQNMSAAISGNFCSVFLDIIDMISQIRGLIAGGKELVEKFQQGDFLGQVSNIKDMIFQLIDTLKNQMLSRLLGLKDSIITKNMGAMSIIIDRYQSVQGGYSDNMIDNIKTRIEEFLRDLTGGYEKLTPEVIAYLMYRFCILIQNIEKLFTAPVESFAQFTDQFRSYQNTLSVISDRNTTRAVGMGFYRMNRESRDRGRDAIALRHSSQTPASFYSGGNSIRRSVTEEELGLIHSAYNPNGNQYIKWGPSVQNMGSDVSDAMVGDGWKKVRQTILLVAIRAAREMGVQLIINSAYRSPQYNARVGGVPGSRHQSGTALDVSYSSFGGRQGANRFVSICQREQIRWHKFYNSFVHIDVGENTNLEITNSSNGIMT